MPLNEPKLETSMKKLILIALLTLTSSSFAAEKLKTNLFLDALPSDTQVCDRILSDTYKLECFGLISRYFYSPVSLDNPGYSLRAFARDLKISPQLLSNVINGKRGLSADLAVRVAKTLGLSEFEKTVFTTSNFPR